MVRRGKVRDLYACGDALIMVATDRISAFDYVLGSAIPDKGRVLTAMSVFWFERLTPNHLVSYDDPRIPAEVRGRALLVRKLLMVDVECVARGYLTGSGMADYTATGVSFLLYSMPPYAIAILMIQLLSISLHVFPSQAPQESTIGGVLAHPLGLVLPIVSLIGIRHGLRTWESSLPTSNVYDRSMFLQHLLVPRRVRASIRWGPRLLIVKSDDASFLRLRPSFRKVLLEFDDAPGEPHALLDEVVRRDIPLRIPAVIEPGVDTGRVVCSHCAKAVSVSVKIDTAL